MIRSDETLDDLTINGLKILQAKNGYRFSVDPVLLCGFITAAHNLRVADLGSGNGIIPLLLAGRAGFREIYGVEIQSAMVERARRSVHLNRLEALVKIIHGDIRELPAELKEQSFDLVTANPPYRNQGSGRVATGDERAMARHELCGGLDSFLRAASSLLVSGGRFYIVYLAERLTELLAEMRCFRLEPKRLRMVHSRAGEPARMVLLEGRKNGKPPLKIEPPLYLYSGLGRSYTKEVLAMYGLAV